MKNVPITPVLELEVQDRPRPPMPRWGGSLSPLRCSAIKKGTEMATYHWLFFWQFITTMSKGRSRQSEKDKNCLERQVS